MEQLDSIIPDPKIFWEWKSNPDPWSTKEAPKWTPYDHLENDLIEQAFQNNQETIEIGDYIICIKDRIQKKRDDGSKKRPIRREIIEDPSEAQEKVRKERFFGGEKPKTFNMTFGTLEDFLQFLQGRGSDIKQFSTVFNEIKISQDISRLNQEIVPLLKECIERESQKPKSLEISAKSQKGFSHISNLFDEKLQSLEHLYIKVLKAYTYDSFLFKNLNSYLRNEDWTQLNSLLPYIFCLCEAFRCSEFQKQTFDISENQGNIIVFRGAAFDLDSLNQYNKQTAENFSWYAVTSTTKNKRIAESFMKNNWRANPKKSLVLFEIEIPLIGLSTRYLDAQSFSDYKGEQEIILAPGSTFELLDIKKGKISEIRLRLVADINRLKHQGHILPRSLQTEIEEGKISKISGLEEEKLWEALCFLKGNQLIQEVRFTSCKFNKEILSNLKDILMTIPDLQKVSFYSTYSSDKHHVANLLSIFVDFRIQSLEIHDKSVQNRHISAISSQLKSWNFLKTFTIHFGKLSENDQNSLVPFQKQDYPPSLSLFFEECDHITERELHDLSINGLSHLTSLTSLNMLFDHCHHLRDEGINSFSENALSKMAELTALYLYLGCCREISDKGIRGLSLNGLKHLKKLTKLWLNFRFCENVMDEGLSSLGLEGLRYLESLETLSLNVRENENITDKGLEDLGIGMGHLKKLKSLNVDVGIRPGWSNQNITDEGLKRLSSQGIKKMKELTILSLDFGGSSGLGDMGLETLSTEGLKCLSNLKSLSVYFGGCPEIGDKGIESFSKEGLRNLPGLKNLKINLERNWTITDEGLGILGGEGLTNLIELEDLTLGFKSCEINDQGLAILSSKGLKFMTKLLSLNLDFQRCGEITDEGLESLSLEGLNKMKSLKILDLNLSNCGDGEVEITSKGIDALEKGLVNKASMTSITFQYNEEEFLTEEDFYCEEASNERVIEKQENKFYGQTELRLKRDLKKEPLDSKSGVDGLINGDTIMINNDQDLQAFLKKFQQENPHLSIPFFNKNDFYIASIILRLNPNAPISKSSESPILQISTQITKLTTLHMNLFGWWELEDQELTDFASQILSQLPFLTTLYLDFGISSSITDEGLRGFCMKGLKNLPKLLHLDLRFSKFCITDKGLNTLGSHGLRYLNSLKTLSLRFKECNLITEKGISVLSSQGLQHLLSLTNLDLEFEKCGQIGDKGLTCLGQALKCLSLLNSLRLCLKPQGDSWEGVSSEGISNFALQGLRFLTLLTSLELDFGEKGKITDEGLEVLSVQGLSHLQNLTNLKMSFVNGSEFTKKGIMSFSVYGIGCLSSLKTLDINFGSFTCAEKGGLSVLAQEGLKNLKLLTSLSIEFGDSMRLADEDLEILGFECFRNMTLLTELNLNFGSESNISDKGIQSLSVKGLKYLTSLCTLKLSLSGASGITDEGLENLSIEALCYLKSLRTLELSFDSCKRITSKGVNSVSIQGLRQLKELEFVKVSFHGTSQLSVDSLQDFVEFLKYLGFVLV